MLLSVVIGDKQLQKVEQHPCGHRRFYEEGEMVFNKIRRPVDPIHQSQPKPNHCQSDEQPLETAFYVHPAQIVTQGQNKGMLRYGSDRERRLERNTGGRIFRVTR